MNTEVVLEGYHSETCCKCRVKFWLPLAMYEVARVRCEEFWFWCPNGHSQHYVRSEDEDGGDPDPGEDIPAGEDGEVVQFPRLKVVA